MLAFDMNEKRQRTDFQSYNQRVNEKLPIDESKEKIFDLKSLDLNKE